MKIAMIGIKGIPAKSGGIEKHVEEISKRLVVLGHSITVYCRNTYINESMQQYEGIDIKIIKTIPNKNLDAIVFTFKATLTALRQGFDIYHYHALGPASLSFIPILFNKKVLVTVHGLDWQREKWGKCAKSYLKFGEYVVGKSKNKIISVSSNLKNYFITKYKKKEEDIFYVPNGVEINSKRDPEAIYEFGLESNEYLLFLARLVPEKGAHYLIEAYGKVDTSKKLVIAGGSSFTDDYVNSLKRLANGNKNIIFTGNVSGRLLHELYSNCYMYILPSDIEGMPLTLLEAMSYGKKCLVSNIPENTDVILDGVYGNIFNKSDVDDLAAKLEYELTNKEINNKSEEIIAYIAMHYDWNEVAKKTLDVYCKITGI